MYLSKFQKADINVSAKASWHLHANRLRRPSRPILKHQEIHHKAYSEYRRGQFARFYSIGGIASTNGIAVTDVAIERHSEAIKLNPDFVEAYFDRAHVYWLIDDFDKSHQRLY